MVPYGPFQNGKVIMSSINWHKVSALPGTLSPNSFYFVENGSYAESYLTNDAGIPKSIGNTAMINALVASALANWSGGASSVTIVPTWAEMQTLLPSLTENSLLLCVDASGDSTVDLGSALYAYDVSAEILYKISEYESMDITISWADIDGRPSSTAAQIDSTVAQSHTHSNKTVLDGFTEVEGKLRYNGAAVSSEWATRNW